MSSSSYSMVTNPDSTVIEEKFEDAIPESELGLDYDGDEPIILKSSDGKEFKTTKQCASISNLVKTILSGDSTATVISLSGVDSKCMRYIVEYMEHYNGTEPKAPEKPLCSKVMQEVCNDDWLSTFVDKFGDDFKTRYTMMTACNNMDIPELINTCGAKIATLIKGQPLEKIQDILATDNVPSKEV